MKIFIFTYDRYETITTAKVVEESGLNFTVLCHSETARSNYVKAGKVRESRILATGEPKGLANNRNFALSMMALGEWALFLVDDWIKATEWDNYSNEQSENLQVPINQTTIYNRRFRKRINFQTFFSRCKETIAKAEKENIALAGFAAYNNPLFRSKKWTTNVLADGRALLVKKIQGLYFDPKVHTIEDMALSADHVTRFGGTLINNWVLAECSRYTRGGYGNMEERMAQHNEEAKYLVKKFPTLVLPKQKPGWPDGSHVVLRKLSQNQLERYRSQIKTLRQMTGYQPFEVPWDTTQKHFG